MYQLCHFTLFGDFAIQDVTTALSLEPSSTIEKGELLDLGGEVVPARVATWDLYGPDNLGVQEQLEFLVTTLQQREEAVRKLAEQFSADICVVLTGESGASGLVLKPDALQKLATMKVTLTCDYIGEEAEDAA
jgi:hypothetical protein